MGWIIDNSTLAVKLPNGTTYVPTAKEIFAAVFKGDLVVDGHQLSVSPERELHGLSFSRYPLELKIRVESLKKGNSLEIYCRVDGLLKSVRVEVQNISNRSSDHIVHDGVWYPFVPDGLHEVQSFLQEADIQCVGRVSLKQYIQMRQLVNGKFRCLQLDDVVTESITTKNAEDSKEDTETPLLTANLYPYQYDGYRWLKMIADEEVGGVLADEMGLGKTLQVIALIADEANKGSSPTLVVAPSTLLENWRREVSRFAPNVRVMIHQGATRTGRFKELQQYDLVVTSYETVLRDLSMLKMINWNLVVLDEAQSIKNPNAKRTKAVKQLPRRVGIAVTGTPVENQLLDLWSIVDFSFPNYLGELSDFEAQYRDEPESASVIEPIVSPILLRRRVSDVAKDLPDRIDVPQVLTLDNRGAVEYEKYRQQILDEYGNGAALVSIGKLRMYCTHPFLITGTNGDPKCTPKYERLVQILEEIISNGEKALIFTSYAVMTDLLLADVRTRFGIYCDWIDGRVPVGERQTKVDAFGAIKGGGVLVLNPKAAGAGLNITTANHVIHYNLEWNPAVEDQASARAYRRGQTRPVTIHRLFYANTVEEIINDRIESKRKVADAAIVGTDGRDSDTEDILKALRVSPIPL